ncbi:glycosyltransferase family 4 protein [Candidatus Peregrinibacteria bacterium]|jgi:glycosyltransferase involved in cell wall biosynthesis|nr:glycosyltransferase family 4 protein [Candidatus Peregrinibacteria bacterium]MBT7484003.1 glycosyltransferase family 4 protein [Candidatus Peregrinibacteria bacterium]MBT7702925.1 glycosyltransferase family 4 protein [Candidatus Peregrinibacteria bacterium]
MKIGIDARMYSSSFTGIGRYVYELTRHLFEMDTQNEYVLFMNEPEFSKFEPPNERVRKILVNARHYSWGEQVKFARILRREKLDLVHFTHFNAPLLYRGPSVVTIHDLTLSFFPGKKMTSWLHRMAYHLVLKSIVKRSKSVIAVSKNTKKDLLKLLKTSSEKVQVIYESAAKEFKPSDAPKENFFLYTGVWRNHKNLVNLLKAFAKLCEQDDFKGKLVITGREDPHYPEAKQTIKELKLENRVDLPGLVSESELLALYQKAKVYVLPSFYEGFGLTPLESMASGTPVVASNTSCIPEICGPENARFFDPYQVENMAKVMSEVWFDEALQKDLRERGLERVKDFSWKQMAKETFKLYNQFP